SARYRVVIVGNKSGRRETSLRPQMESASGSPLRRGQIRKHGGIHTTRHAGIDWCRRAADRASGRVDDLGGHEDDHVALDVVLGLALEETSNDRQVAQ